MEHLFHILSTQEDRTDNFKIQGMGVDCCESVLLTN